ncbi:MAG: ABC transporter permease [Clostridiaceae bacterium]|jgi:spermidine/putrescine transport system permease protein|nr:ABC transporter permease [Clostridiaceae bacterium]
MNRKWLATPYLIWMVIFIVIPLLMIFYYAFTVSDSSGTRFTLEHMMKSFDRIYMVAIGKSLLYAVISTVICLLLAYPLALILIKRSSGGSAMLFIFILPMWMNFLLRTYAWLSLLETNNGLINTVLRALHLPVLDVIGTPKAIILGMVYNFLPFMVLPIYNALAKIDKSVMEAAYDLGANDMKRLLKVTIPLSMPGVMSGITMVFMPAMTSFVIPNLLGSGKVNLIGNMIEQQFLMTYDWGFGAALSFVLMIIILISMSIIQRNDGEMEGGAGIW